jgi:hypothetical protein
MDTGTSSGLIGLLPFWILIAGAVLVAATGLNRDVRRSHGSRMGSDTDPRGTAYDTRR